MEHCIYFFFPLNIPLKPEWFTYGQLGGILPPIQLFG